MTCGGILGTGCLGNHFFVFDEVPSAAMPPQALQLEHRVQVWNRLIRMTL